jgi:hypothetical protein
MRKDSRPRTADNERRGAPRNPNVRESPPDGARAVDAA